MACLIWQVTFSKPVPGRNSRRKHERNNSSPSKPAAKFMFAIYSSSKQGNKGEMATLPSSAVCIAVAAINRPSKVVVSSGGRKTHRQQVNSNPSPQILWNFGVKLNTLLTPLHSNLSKLIGGYGASLFSLYTARARVNSLAKAAHYSSVTDAT